MTPPRPPSPRRRLLAAAGGLLLLAAALALPERAQAQGVLERVRAAGTVRVCVWPDYYGVSWRNPRTQQFVGIDIDLSA